MVSQPGQPGLWALDLLELTDVRGVTVRALSAHPAGVQAGLRRLFEDGHRIALLNDTALF